MKGIDISQFNIVRSFEQVKDSGMDFVIVRLTGSKSGKIYHDVRGYEYVRAAAAAGLHVGAYAFTRPDLSGYNYLDDALFFLDYMPKDVRLTMPVYIDVEGWTKNKAKNTEYVHNFCKTLEERGYYAGIYGSDISTFKDLLFKDNLKHWTWWVARYGNEPSYARDSMGMWQKTSTGQVPGVLGNVDIDICYKNFPDAILKHNLNIRR